VRRHAARRPGGRARVQCLRVQRPARRRRLARAVGLPPLRARGGEAARRPGGPRPARAAQRPRAGATVLVRPYGGDPLLPLRGRGWRQRTVPRHARRGLRDARLDRGRRGPRAGKLHAVALRALALRRRERAGADGAIRSVAGQHAGEPRDQRDEPRGIERLRQEDLV